jgi:formate dehydrogenase subunit gamma
MNAERTPVRTERTFQRFSLSQRLEHLILLATFIVLLLTGLPQKYRAADWSAWILSTPERLYLIQRIHHIAALALTAEAFYHLGKAIYLISRRKLPGALLPTTEDVRDAGQMLAYLLFMRKTRPNFGKYDFEQKFTYWFIFVSIGMMVVSGFILWFPAQITRVVTGAAIPAALLAHSNEAIIAGVFVIAWHLFHVLILRVNLSIFTGRLSENEMRTYHAAEFERLTGEPADGGEPGTTASRRSVEKRGANDI